MAACRGFCLRCALGPAHALYIGCVGAAQPDPRWRHVGGAPHNDRAREQLEEAATRRVGLWVASVVARAHVAVFLLLAAPRSLSQRRSTVLVDADRGGEYRPLRRPAAFRGGRGVPTYCCSSAMAGRAGACAAPAGSSSSTPAAGSSTARAAAADYCLPRPDDMDA